MPLHWYLYFLPNCCLFPFKTLEKNKLGTVCSQNCLQYYIRRQFVFPGKSNSPFLNYGLGVWSLWPVIQHWFSALNLHSGVQQGRHRLFWPCQWLAFLRKKLPMCSSVALFWVFGVAKAHLACLSEACDHPFWLTVISVLTSSNGSPYQKSELASEGINQSLQFPLTPVVCTPGQTHCFALFHSTKAVAPNFFDTRSWFPLTAGGGDGFGVIQCITFIVYFISITITSAPPHIFRH